MHRPLLALLIAGLFGAPVAAADSPLAGTWKVVIMNPQQEFSIWILQIDDKGQASVVAEHPGFKGTKVEKVRIDDKGAHLDLKVDVVPLHIDAYVPQGDKKPEKLFGSVEVRGRRDFLRLQRTADKTIDEKGAAVESPSAPEFKKLVGIKDEKEREAALKELVKKYPDQPAGYVAALGLLSQAIKAGAEADARTAADQAIKAATVFGPETQRTATQQAAQSLARADKLGAAALDYARQAAKLVGDADPASVQAPVLKALASALRKAGKTDELKPLEARIAQLDDQLDQEFLKNAIPFKPETFAGRKGKGDRVVVTELFTGAQCPPCVAADVAFDALLKTYKPADVVFLQYHLHIPGPDALTNPGSEKRSEFYGVEGTPSIYFDGKTGPPMGGAQAHAKDRYEAARKLIDAQLEAAPQAKLKLTAQRKGDTIDVQADYSDLAKTGDNVRLRFVVVEDVVRYPGGNGQRLHHHVVRALPGGAEGFALKEKAGKQSVTVDVAELQKSLRAYLDDLAKSDRLTDDERPLDLKQLKVVALIQDNANKEVLQAAQADILQK